MVSDSLRPHGLYSLQARIREWVAFPYSRGSSHPRDRTQVSCIAGGLFTSWATRETQEYWNGYPFSSGSSQPRNWTGVCYIAGGFFTNWAMREALSAEELMAFELWCWRRLLRVPWTARRSNQLILKEINPKYALERLMLKLQYFGHLTWRADSLGKTVMLRKIERRRRGRQSMRWLDGIIGSMDMGLSKLWEMVKDRGAWHAVVHGVTKNQTWLHDWTTNYRNWFGSWNLLKLRSIEPVMPSIQPAHPVSPPSPPAFNLSQHHGLFQWVSFSYQVARVLELQYQSFQWIFVTDFL